MNSALHVQSLGKSYRQWGNEWRRFASWMMPSIQPREEHWVLKEVSFSVEPGEAIGIIGQNGAGKSTLLKLITGTVLPTEGRVLREGSVAAILELGMGFSPDLTGRQNTYHSAGLMGYSQAKIESVMTEIEAFAEVGDYFDQPVRTYSSGMQMRVAFSVATAFRPDVLIVDEALSVGDVYFQQKCFKRIREFSKQGTTLLFVTHDITAVLEICSRALYLREGHLVIDGPPQTAVDLYQADALIQCDNAPAKLNVVKLFTEIDQSPPISPKDQSNTVTGSAGSLLTSDINCLSVSLKDSEGKELLSVISECHTKLVIRYNIHRELDDPHVGFKIRNRFGTVIFETNTYCMGKRIGRVDKNTELEVCFNFPVDLTPGEYTITLGFANRGFDKGSFEEVLSYLHSALVFTVLPNNLAITWCGILNIHPKVGWAIFPDVPLTEKSLFGKVK
jgi:lipopolysaccharide transport system ATP-binding protein